MTKKPTPSPSRYAELWIHMCEHFGCLSHGGFGFGPLKHPELVHWFCGEHRGEGETNRVRA